MIELLQTSRCRILGLVTAFCSPMLTGIAQAAMDAPPAIPASIESSPSAAPAKSLARVELATGAPLLLSAGRVWRAETGQALGDGDVLQVPEGARVRMVFANGDALHLGAGTLLDVKEQTDGWLARMWRGAAAIYAAPGARGRGLLETQRGVLEAGEGKMGVVAPEIGGAITLYAFNNWRAWEGQGQAYALDAASQDWRVNAIWHGVGGDIPVQAGDMLRVADATRRAELNPEFEVDFTYHTSPEADALRLAVNSYDQGDRAAAQSTFGKIQQAFPKNSFAAYYLGLIALESEKTFEAIRQWQLYAQLDPEGAARRGVPGKLTLMVNQQLKDEIEQALKQEGSMSDAKPEPGTVAVLPYINRGDAAQAVLAKGLTALIVTDLSKVPGLKVLERAKLQKLVDELTLSKSGIVEQQSALRAGRLMRAEKLLIGDYKVENLK